MIATDRPRFSVCPSCVRARGLERGDAFARVAVDMSIRGPCDDCGAVEELEAWRRLDAPPPAPTVRMLPTEGD